jgi:predicted DNA-binding transcriptional regulator AlpA
MDAVCGLKRSQRDDLISRGEFPAPIRLAGLGGRAKGWLASEISEWQRKRLAERDADIGAKRRSR